jgi:uncharacterized protein (DUF1501 family)
LKIGAAKSATMVMTDRQLDVHAPLLARALPNVVRGVAKDVAAALDYLAATPYDETRSLLDFTTVMINSEMSRTMRQLAADSVDRTGTDHNPFTNTVLLAGKDVRGGLVLGASDFQTADEDAGVNRPCEDDGLEPELRLRFRQALPPNPNGGVRHIEKYQ